MKVTIRQILKIYWQHVARHKILFFGFLITAIAASVTNIIIPWYLKKFFDLFTQHFAAPADLARALIYAWGMVMLWNFAKFIFYRTASVINVYFQPYVMTELDQTAFEHILQHSYRFFSNSFAGSLVRRVSRFGRSFENVADRLFWDLMDSTILVAGSLYIFYLRQPRLALILGVWVIIFVVANFLFSYWKLPQDTKRADIESEVSGKIADAFSNSLTIQQFSGFDFERSAMKAAHERLRKIYTLTWGLGELNTAVQVLLMLALEYFCITTAITFYVAGKLTLGDFALIQSALVSIIGSLWGFGRVLRGLYEGFADAKETVEILLEPHEIVDAPRAQPLNISDAQIAFHAVTFGYSSAAPIVRDMSFSSRSKEKIAFVGSSGAGKTTVIKILLRYFDIQRGMITIDGQDISKVQLSSLRNAISLVPQDPILFHRSLMENIRYGKRGATDEEVIAAAKKAYCHEFITGLEKGYDTLVGERGVKLSGGERQRVAIARAILKNAPILVLDEATSSLDSESEQFIQDALVQLMKDKTVIVIAHRLSTIMQMDRILVVEDGHIVDEGTHDELYKRAGKYKRLWKIQAGGFKEKPAA